MKCSRSTCDEDAIAHWPAFDRHVKPAPYCNEHLKEAQRSMVLDGPHLLSLVKPKQQLVTV
jgi:hypothetical protein